jgi:hypothetical protein
MRTKTLLLTTAVAAVGIATSMAQTVYSVNAVGFVNVTVPAGQFALLANPLNQATNDLVSVLPDFPGNNSQVFVFDGAGFQIFTKRSSGAWTGTGFDTARLDPGKGFFVKNVGTTDMKLTFIGEVPQGAPLTTPISAGFNLIGSKVPQAGGVETQLGMPSANNDKVYVLGATGYTISTRRATSWTPSEPQIGVAQGFWIQAVAAGSWARTFNVNTP